jgi:hypothetical protein
VKIAALLLCALGLLFADDREGNFEIRFEPTAKLQTNVDVPFEIYVKDGRKQLLPDAKVEVTISLKDGSQPAKLPARAITPGLYIVKPNFPVPGTWDVEVIVRRNDQTSRRTKEFSVVE